jgi:hypothetical protein
MLAGRFRLNRSRRQLLMIMRFFVLIGFGSGLVIRPIFAQEVGASLSDTIAFISGCMKAGGILTNRERTLRHTQLFSSKGCYATVTDLNQTINTQGGLDGPLKIIDQYSLGDIDPASIKVVDYSEEFPNSTSIELDTTDFRDVVARTSGSVKMNVANPGFIIDSDYAPRFVKALKHAIELCGGRRSAF